MFKFPHGGFNPVISDGRKLYLTGYASLYGLAPKTAEQRAAARRRIRARHARERSQKRQLRRRKGH